MWVYDELGLAPNRQLLDALQTASGKRDRSLGIVISTQAASDRDTFSLLIDDAIKSKTPASSCKFSQPALMRIRSPRR